MWVFHQSRIVLAVWALLALTAIGALVFQRWSLSFVASATLAVSILPPALAARFRIHLPFPFLAFTTFFVVATLFLGEAFDFYDRYWWWDLALHGTSAIGFGLVGFIVMFALFEGDRYAAPPLAVAFFAWCFAIAMGTAWEIFEFAMDSLFGTNMVKSGMRDTFGDLIVNMVGAFVGAASGYLYLIGLERGGLFAWLIADFVRLNRGLFRRHDR